MGTVVRWGRVDRNGEGEVMVWHGSSVSLLVTSSGTAVVEDAAGPLVNEGQYPDIVRLQHRAGKGGGKEEDTTEFKVLGGKKRRNGLVLNEWKDGWMETYAFIR